MRTTLHRLGSRWGRPRLAMPRKADSQKAAKQWRIAKAVAAAGPKELSITYSDVPIAEWGTQVLRALSACGCRPFTLRRMVLPLLEESTPTGG